MISILFSIFFSDTGAGSSPIGAPHRVLIASEEQLQTKILPSLTAHKKYKLTAHEGARIRKIGFVTFLSKADKDHSENCLTCLTNQGDLVIHSLPELRRQVLQVSFSKKRLK
jgi:lethal(2) giant larvae protein